MLQNLSPVPPRKRQYFTDVPLFQRPRVLIIVCFSSKFLASHISLISRFMEGNHVFVQAMSENGQSGVDLQFS